MLFRVRAPDIRGVAATSTHSNFQIGAPNSVPDVHPSLGSLALLSRVSRRNLFASRIREWECDSESPGCAATKKLYTFKS